MILGTGIDIIQVARVAEKVRKKAFTTSVFSAAEIAYCEGLPNKHEHYAARFAAKEAFLKATGLGLGAEHELSNIEILHDEHGKPDVVLHGTLKERAVSARWDKIHVSLSHIETVACAMVIIERRD